MTPLSVPAKIFLGSALVVVPLLAVSGCGGGGDRNPKTIAPALTPIATPILTSTPVSPTGNSSGLIGPAGGVLSLPNIGQVTFPAGAFTVPTQVTLLSAQDPDTATTFNVSAPIFGAGNRLAYEIKVTSDRAPSKNVTFQVNVPAGLTVPAGQNLEAFVQIYETQGLSILDNFDLLSSTYNAAARTVTVSVPAAAFTSMRRSDGKFDAIVTLAPTAGAATTGTGTGSSSGCQGAAIGSPLKSTLQVASAFNPPAHYGTDFRVSASGEDVVPVADGTIDVIGFDARPLPKPDPRSGKAVKGWGRYVIVKHSDGSRSLYAHLVQNSTNALTRGQAVVKGQTVLGTTDSTGGSSGPHLHLEYAPNGSIFNKKSKIDPAPCIGNNVKTSIVVGDNGPAADDAFEVFVDGLSIGRTTIGGTNSLGASNLRPGNHILKVTAIIAPDNFGTLGVTLQDGFKFADGSVTQSANLDEGASVTYTFIVPSGSLARTSSNSKTPALPPVSPNSKER